MAQKSYVVDQTDASSVEALLSAFEAHQTPYEAPIRTLLTLRAEPFRLRLDFVSRPQLSPLDEPFTYDKLLDEVLVYRADAVTVVDALMEVVMAAQGFQLSVGAFDEWQSQFISGTLRHARSEIKNLMEFPTSQPIRFPVDAETVERYNVQTFESMLYLAGLPDLDLTFPEGADAYVVEVYHRLRRIMQAIAYGIDLTQGERFNRRVARAQRLVAESILPGEPSIFDDLLGLGGFDDRYFSEAMDE